MTFYINEECIISDIYQYDEERYGSKDVFFTYIIGIFIGLIVGIGISFFIKYSFKLSTIYFLIVTLIITIPNIFLFSFLFGGHNEARKRYFAYSKEDNRLFIIEKLSSEERKPIGLTYNQVFYEKMDLKMANSIVNSYKPLSFYVYEVLNTSSFLITPQGIGYNFEVLKKIRYMDEIKENKEKDIQILQN